VRRPLAGPVLKWAIGPAAVLVLSAALGEERSNDRPGTLLARTASLPDAELRKLEGASASALANATWAFGSREAVRAMLRAELERLPGGPERARVLLRFALVDDNPDGHAALVAQACAADPSTCDHPGNAAALQVRQRFVAPGNRLPSFLLEGHPSIAE
jgi:hypothetical protein